MTSHLSHGGARALQNGRARREVKFCHSKKGDGEGADKVLDKLKEEGYKTDDT